MEEMPTGFRFFPTEEELISFYLNNKLEDKNCNINRVIPMLDIYQLDPWHLPSTYLLFHIHASLIYT